MMGYVLYDEKTNNVISNGFVIVNYGLLKRKKGDLKAITKESIEIQAEETTIIPLSDVFSVVTSDETRVRTPIVLLESEIPEVLKNEDDFF